MRRHIGLVILGVVISISLNGETTENNRRNRIVEAVYVQNTHIRPDGILDEKAWNQGTWQGYFTQRQPHDGQQASCKTEFKVFYDDEYLYVGARAYDPNPDQIKAILSRRDEYTQSDWMYISIDSYNDNRTAFEFGINAAGVLHDIRRYDDEDMDEDWDAVWDGAANIDDKGWTAEWRIPFSELRFTTSANMQWGFNMYREAPNCNNEVTHWNYWSQAEQGFVSNYGTLNGLKNIQSSNPVYIIPYVVGRTDISDHLVTPNHPEKYDIKGNIGGDIRYSSPIGITLNATINPDFGQVEADPANYNLTAFETYFSEKRTFFMEGANILNYPLGFGDGDMQNNALFYSRRIGKNPSGRVNTDSNKNVEEIEYPDQTHILGAVKVTGKTSDGVSIGIMEALTAEEKATVYYDDGTKDHSVVEPLTNYGLIRLQKDFHDGNTAVGGILTGVNRKLDGTGINTMHTSAYTGGMDMTHRFADNEYMFISTFAFSHVTGDTTAIQRTQKAPSRYFQRPDADHLTYDPTRESLSGFAYKTIIIKNQGHVRGAVGNVAASPGFEINDLGFLQNVDNLTSFLWLQYRTWEPGKVFKSTYLNFNLSTNHDFSGMKKNLGGNVNFQGNFLNNWTISTGTNINGYGLAPYYNRGGPVLRTPKGMNGWYYIRSDQRKKIIWETNGYCHVNSDDVISYETIHGITFRPLNNLHFIAQAGYNVLDDTWAWIGKAQGDGLETQYVWADMIQKTINITFRTNWTLTPRLSLQYFAQPFFTTGQFSNYKRLNDPLARDFDKRFEDVNNRMIYDDESGEYHLDLDNDGTAEYSFRGYTDFNYKQFRSNMVLRWEYSSGSAVYLVWSQGFTDFRNPGSFDISRDVQNLFGSTGDNVLMVKVSHMFKK